MQCYDTVKHGNTEILEWTENLEIKLILSISTELCDKNIMLG